MLRKRLRTWLSVIDSRPQGRHQANADSSKLQKAKHEGFRILNRRTYI